MIDPTDRSHTIRDSQETLLSLYTLYIAKSISCMHARERYSLPESRLRICIKGESSLLKRDIERVESPREFLACMICIKGESSLLDMYIERVESQDR